MSRADFVEILGFPNGAICMVPIEIGDPLLPDIWVFIRREAIKSHFVVLARVCFATHNSAALDHREI